MEDRREQIIKGLPALVEQELLKQIQDAYEDVMTTANEKRAERERLTQQYVKKWAKELSVSEDKIRGLVDVVIKRTRWIKEIEELDEEEEEIEER